MRSLLLIFLSLLTLNADLAWSRDIFVNNLGGNDTHDGRTLLSTVPGGGAVRSINKALRLAQGGDRIILENTGQPYQEAISLIGSRHSGTVLSPMVIEGRGAILDGSVPIPDEAWEHFSGNLFAYRPDRLGYQRLFLDGKPAIERPVAKESIQTPPLAPREWCLWQGRILFCVDQGRMPSDYHASCCGLQTGITLYYVHDVLIRDLLVQGFAVDGIAVHDVVRDARLERVTSRDNGMSGISVRGASWLELDDCTLVGNGVSQLRLEEFARCWIHQNKLSPVTQPDIELKGGQVFQVQVPFAKSLP